MLFRPAIPLLISIVIGIMIGAENETVGASAAIGGVLGFLLLSVPLLIGGLVTKVTTEVALTNQRVILKWGIIQTNSIETYLDKVGGIDVHQSILGRLLGYGSISVNGTGVRCVPCPGIASPQEFRHAVNEHIQNTRISPSSGFTPPRQPSPQRAQSVVATMPRYYYSSESGDSGPHSLEEMRRFRHSGKFTQETLVFREGDKEWQPALLFFRDMS